MPTTAIAKGNYKAHIKPFMLNPIVMMRSASSCRCTIGLYAWAFRAAQVYADRLKINGIDDERMLPYAKLKFQDFAVLKIDIGYLQTVIDGIATLPPAIPPASETAKGRFDFVVRLFAIAISVGVASRIAQMSGAARQCRDSEDISALYGTASHFLWLGMIPTRAVSRSRPGPRFAVDLAVVVASMLFLFSSKYERLWLAFPVLIFALYLLWDILFVGEYPNEFDGGDEGVLEVYKRGFADGRTRGPAATLSLLFFFAFICVERSIWFADNLAPRHALRCWQVPPASRR